MGQSDAKLGGGIINAYSRILPDKTLYGIRLITEDPKIFVFARRDYPVKRFAVIGDDLYDASGPFVYRTLEDPEGKNPVARRTDTVNDLVVVPKRTALDQHGFVIDDEKYFDVDAGYCPENVLYDAAGKFVFRTLQDTDGNPVAERRGVVTDLVVVRGVLHDSAGGLVFKTLRDYHGTEPISKRGVPAIGGGKLDVIDMYKTNTPLDALNVFYDILDVLNDISDFDFDGLRASEHTTSIGVTDNIASKALELARKICISG